MKKTLLVLPLALLFAALALSACGGGGSSSSGGGEEAEVETAIEEAALSTEPSKCTEFQTESFNEEEAEGANPLKACEEEVEAEEDKTESVDVSNVAVNGKSATAEVAITGSTLDNQSVEVEAVNEGGNWKLNKFLGFAKFDAAALGEEFEKGLEEAEELEPKQISCISEGVAGLSQKEAEEFVFGKKLEKLKEVAEGCK